MKQRIITAIWLIVLVLGCMFALPSAIPMAILMLVLAGMAGYEWYKLMPASPKNAQNSPQKQKNDAILYGVIIAWLAGLPIATTFFTLNYTFMVMKYILILVSAFWAFSVYWVLQYPRLDEQWYNTLLYSVGCILISSASFAMFFLWKMSPEYLLYMFLLVWGADSGAYFIGRKFGKTKLSPQVSPNKSVEGLIGGIFTTILMMIVIVAFGSLTMSVGQWIVFLIIAILTVMASVQGDLFESMIKRRAGIKDSGTILPGHGGVLDRVDSLLAAAPIFLLGLYLLDWLGVAV